MGVLYDTGQGVSQDPAKALAWYRRAAEAGSPAGAFNVGVFYDSGLGMQPDEEQAAFWYGRAASEGFARAEYNLALLYEEGAGVPKNRERAVALFRQAAAQGLTAARAHLASLGQRFVGPASKPAQDAMTDFQRAQDILLNRGPAEAAQVAALFHRAADRHNAVAEYDLGYCYEHGVGVPADRTQAVDWYHRAAADTRDDALRGIAKASAAKLEGQTASTGKPGQPSQPRSGG